MTVDAPAQRAHENSPRVVTLLLRVVLLRWATASGMPPRRLALTLALGTAALTTTSLFAVLGLQPEQSGAGADVWLFGICFTAFLVSSAVGIMGSHFSEGIYADLRLLRVRPVGPRVTSWLTRAPAGVLGACLAVVVWPAATLAVERTAGYGILHAVVGSGCTMVGGACLGWLGHWAGGFVLHGPRLRTLRLSATLAVWLCVCVGGLTIFASGVQMDDEGYEPLLRTVYLVWPLFLWLLLSASPAAYAASVGVTVAVCVLVSRTSPRADPVLGSPVRFQFDSTRPALPTRLIARRLLRHPRGQEWLLMGMFGSLLAAGLGLYASQRLPVTMDLSVVFVLGVGVSVSFTCLVRGISSRERPLEQRLGAGAVEHVIASVGACLGLAMVVIVPVVVVAAASPSPGVIGAMALAAVVDVCVGVGISFLLAPRLGSGGEMAAFLAYLVVGLALAGAADSVSGLGASAMRVTGGAVFVAIGIAAESRRRASVDSVPTEGRRGSVPAESAVPFHPSTRAHRESS